MVEGLQSWRQEMSSDQRQALLGISFNASASNMEEL